MERQLLSQMASKRQHKLFWGSSYDRGLDILLDMWPEIIAKFPNATLDVCYGWDLFDARFRNNPERMSWRNKLAEQMKSKGITHYGRVGKKELANIRSRCGVWAYPTYFPEINCITALDAQGDGLVPVCTDLAALSETVGAGVRITGDIYLPKTRKNFLEALLGVMENEDYWNFESKKAMGFAKDYKWENIAKIWTKYF
jgi:glycosyltransferase involved in cell wall biosynthesis